MEFHFDLNPFMNVILCLIGSLFRPCFNILLSKWLNWFIAWSRVSSYFCLNKSNLEGRIVWIECLRSSYPNYNSFNLSQISFSDSRELTNLNVSGGRKKCNSLFAFNFFLQSILFVFLDILFIINDVIKFLLSSHNFMYFWIIFRKKIGILVVEPMLLGRLK